MRCPVFKECGGCLYKHEHPDFQHVEKQNQLLKDFSRLDDFLVMEDPFFYRHKVIATFQRQKNRVVSGLYKSKTHRVVSTKECLIENLVARKIINSATKLIESFKYPIYDQDKYSGIFRHMMVRVGYQSNEVMVVFVVTETRFKGKRQFINALLKKHPEITTIVFNINKRRTSVVLSDTNETAYGPGFIYDSIGDKRFKLSPNSFYQVNPEMTKRLYEKAIELANINKEDRVLDTYCGIGTITIMLSDYSKEVVGVELNKQAINDAKTNLRLNKTDNVDFIQADSTEFMLQLNQNPFSVLFMDPPRDGSTPEFLNQAIELNFNKIVYISCNPTTLKRDLEILNQKYELNHLFGVHQFPFTDHVECIAVLSNR